MKKIILLNNIIINGNDNSIMCLLYKQRTK